MVPIATFLSLIAGAIAPHTSIPVAAAKIAHAVGVIGGIKEWTSAAREDSGYSSKIEFVVGEKTNLAEYLK